MGQKNGKYQLILNKLTLSFAATELEKEFREDYFKKSLNILRISLFTSVVLYTGFGWLDTQTSPTFTDEFWIIRFFIVVPLLLFVIGTTYLKSFYKYWQIIMSAISLVSGGGIIYMLHRNPENLYYYGGLFLIFMGMYFFIKIRFFAASISGLILVLIYNIAYFIIPDTVGSSYDNVITANAFFISSNIICMLGLYNIERLERIDFHQQRLLAEKQIEIERNNARLEKTVKIRTEDLIIAKDKAEHSDKLKSAFLANMSHEIRTPMNGILGFSDLLKNPKLSGEEQQRFISIIEKSGERMLSTVNDIIEISKIESGQMELHATNINIIDETQSLFEFFNHEAKTKGLKLLLDIQLNKSDSILYTDQSKFSSILTNLVKNAIKYTDEGYVKIVCKKKNEFIEFEIRDSGIGIPPDRIDAVFNRFEQADILDKHARQGSGLGLAICKSYVKMLGGNIWVESKVAENEETETSGSVFSFSLPVVHKQLDEQKNNVDEQQLVEARRICILIVEDDYTSLEYLRTVLKTKISELFIAKTGIEAIEQVKANANINLVLMDIKMPEMNGFDATRLIKEINPKLPIIATTAYSYPEDEEKAKQAGCDGFIAKPINKNELFALMSKLA
jgi:signal transduction histidine kinase/CheY-like chemotaxis protein